VARAVRCCPNRQRCLQLGDGLWMTMVIGVLRDKRISAAQCAMPIKTNPAGRPSGGHNRRQSSAVETTWDRNQGSVAGTDLLGGDVKRRDFKCAVLGQFPPPFFSL
jgi:hypothetical protein